MYWLSLNIYILLSAQQVFLIIDNLFNFINLCCYANISYIFN